MCIPITSIHTTVWKTMQRRKPTFFGIKMRLALPCLITTIPGRAVLVCRHTDKPGLPVLSVVEVLLATPVLSSPFPLPRHLWLDDTIWKIFCSLRQLHVCWASPMRLLLRLCVAFAEFHIDWQMCVYMPVCVI